MRRTVFALVSTLVLGCPLVVRGDEFPKPYNSEPAESGQPWSPAEAAAKMRAPEGFHVNVFAAEPDVANPIALAWDARGRLWIAENYTYAERPKKFDLGLRDRVIILSDQDGDGVQDHRSVFADDLQMLTSIELGLGGVWAVCPPQLLFIPDRNRDDRPDGPAEVVLDGFEVPAESYHNFANGLRWGPDGWLYGRCGATAPGNIGAPGTPADQRVPLRGGMWRYHPQRKVFEALCHGTTNPWGHDWDENGEAFFVNTVNGHLWHMIPGAHFVRPHTIDPNPRVYESIDMHADHWHWDTGKDWTDSRSATGEHDRLGGGHAHSGTTIYLADQWPAQHRGRLFTLNMHGRRVNEERLERSGSGYIGRHEPDMLFAADPWFRGIDLTYGPDGSVFILDWSDSGECHESTGVHRTSGRIYRVTYGNPPRVSPPDLTRLKLAELVALQRHKNEWFARQSRRELLDRQAAGQDMNGVRHELSQLFETELPFSLRVLWTRYALGGVHEKTLVAMLDQGLEEHMHVWALRLLSDRWPLDTIMGPQGEPAPAIDSRLLARLMELAEREKSGLVRLTLASMLQRLPVAQRPPLAQALAFHVEDAEDHNLPSMVWYGLIPVADRDPQALVPIGATTRWPLLRKWVARRLAEDLAKNPAPLNGLLEDVLAARNAAMLGDVLTGITEGLAGWRKAPQPAAWAAVQTAAGQLKMPPNVDDQIRELSVLFGDGRALDEVRQIALDDKAEMNHRKAALLTLIESRPPELRSICEKLLGVRFLNTIAVRGLSLFNDPSIGVKLARSYKAFHQTERPEVLETLVSRPAFAAALLDEMAAGKIPRTDLSAFQARQIRSFNDPKLARRLVEVWGEVRESPHDKQQLITQLKQRLTPDVLSAADLGQGRLVFNNVCANCHRLYGRGAEIGPDLTGAGRQNIDYVLGNVVDPSATVAADFRMSVVVLDDGRVLNGIIRAQTARTITLQTAKERISLDRSDIEQIETSPLSLMPEGLLQPLKPEQVRDLVAYLMTRSQIPLPPETASAVGKDEG
jgi:putative membrane-bound dehydrogenase-like protein